MITKNELEKYRGSKVGEALVKLSVAEGFKCENNYILVSISDKTFTQVSDIIKLLDFIKSNLKLQKEEPCLEIGNNMANATGPSGPNSSINHIDFKHWDTLISIIQ
ncbi:hypothetical protein [Segatella paludivivens]|uniref:hypothetical protein n=1 Tax=Segatella paludivivens TaxID=185294 RepID=UPI0003763044|nr:hypothetical protein [Segatella paludivivens]